MSNYDTIEEIEVAKFNPFHDRLGRFSNAQGFNTYSANPKTLAGAKAISRSFAGGHGSTLNVHRESKGEDISQNAAWLAYGTKPAVPAAQAQAQNQQTTATKPKPKKKPQPKPQDDDQTDDTKQTDGEQSLKDNVQDVQLNAGDRLAMVPRKWDGTPTVNTTKIADDHYQDRVAGKDISAKLDVSSIPGSKEPIDKVAELQGWNKPATVETDLGTFQKAAKQSGVMLIRSVDKNWDTGEPANSVCKKTMTDGNAPLGGNGAKLYGGGIYTVGVDVKSAYGKNLSRKIYSAQSESYGYGPTQMLATVHPSAKIATYNRTMTLESQYCRMTSSQKAKFGYDVGTFIASKGYDGATWHSGNDPYVTVYNKSAMIFYSDVSTAN